MPRLLFAVIACFAASARAEDSARIYLYAQSSTAARSWLPIFCDGTAVAKLKRGTFFAIEVAPGRHFLALSAGKGIPVFVNVLPGEEAFVSLDWQIDRDGPPIPSLEIVQSAHARTRMLNLRYIDSGKVLSGLVPKADPRGPPQLQKRRSGE